MNEMDIDNGYHEKRKVNRRKDDDALKELVRRISWGKDNDGLTKAMCQRIHDWYQEDRGVK